MHVVEDMQIAAPYAVNTCVCLLGNSSVLMKQKVLQDLCLLCNRFTIRLLYSHCIRADNRDQLLNNCSWQLNLISLIDPLLYQGEDGISLFHDIVIAFSFRTNCCTRSSCHIIASYNVTFLPTTKNWLAIF